MATNGAGGDRIPELELALRMLDDSRERTLAAVEGLDPAAIDAIPIGGGNTIGALLYHIAATERMWLYERILERPSPDWAERLFPLESHEESGRLTPVRGMALSEHVSRLTEVRRHLRDDLARLTPEEFRQPHDTMRGWTPEWALHHLRDHEAEHRGQLQEVRTLLRQRR